MLAVAFFAMSLCVGISVHAAAPRPPLMAVLPFEIDDNSGEIGSADRHTAMLSAVTTTVRNKIEATGRYRVVPHEAVTQAINAVNPGTYLRDCNGCELDIAKRLNAQRVLVGWIFKMSTLIGTLHIRIEDVGTRRVVYRRDFDFRGDNERAWNRAADVFVRTLSKDQ
jgi:hypothetical protein